MIIDVYVYMVFSLVTIIYVEYFLELFSKHLKHGVYIYIYIYQGSKLCFVGLPFFEKVAAAALFLTFG